MEAARGALPVGSQLESRGANANVKCYHCGGAKIIDHLLLHYPFAQEVWELAPLNDTISSLTIPNIQASLIESTQMICLPPTSINEGSLLPWIAWSIWLARNQKIFQN